VSHSAGLCRIHLGPPGFEPGLYAREPAAVRRVPVRSRISAGPPRVSAAPIQDPGLAPRAVPKPGTLHSPAALPYSTVVQVVRKPSHSTKPRKLGKLGLTLSPLHMQYDSPEQLMV
jgi:hypothetical protein